MQINWFGKKYMSSILVYQNIIYFSICLSFNATRGWHSDTIFIKQRIIEYIQTEISAREHFEKKD